MRDKLACTIFLVIAMLWACCAQGQVAVDHAIFGGCPGGVCQPQYGMPPQDSRMFKWVRPAPPQRRPQQQPYGELGIQVEGPFLSRLNPQLPAICVVKCLDRDRMHSYGLGCLLYVHPSKDYALVSTAWHVVQDAIGIDVIFANGEKSAGRIDCKDTTYDFALIAVSKRIGNIVPPTISTKRVYQSDKLYLTLARQGRLQLYETRAVKFVMPSRDTRKFVVASIPAVEGDSGGPVFDSERRLTGWTWGSVDGTAHCGQFAEVWPLVMQTFPNLIEQDGSKPSMIPPEGLSIPPGQPADKPTESALDQSSDCVLMGRLVDVEKQVDDHEKRLKALEDSPDDLLSVLPQVNTCAEKVARLEYRLKGYDNDNDVLRQSIGDLLVRIEAMEGQEMNQQTVNSLQVQVNALEQQITRNEGQSFDPLNLTDEQVYRLAERLAGRGGPMNPLFYSETVVDGELKSRDPIYWRGGLKYESKLEKGAPTDSFKVTPIEEGASW